MKTIKNIFLALFCLTFQALACSEAPDQPTLTVIGASAAPSEDNYYLVEVPIFGEKEITVSAFGEVACPTDDEKCKCQDKSEDPEKAGELEYTFQKPSSATQDPSTGGIVKFKINSTTEPGEYHFKLTKLKQKYKACPSGWEGGPEGNVIENTEASDEVIILVYKIETETVETYPTNRERRTVGIGEEVNVKFLPSGQSPSWAVDGNAVLSTPTGDSTVFTASDDAVTSKITVTTHGIDSTLNIISIVPDNIYAVKDAPACFSGIRHTEMGIFIKATPDTVSFRKCEMSETSGSGTNVLGWFTGFTPAQLYHTSGGWIDLGGFVPYDTAGGDFTGPDYPITTSAGSFDIIIPYNFRVKGLGTKIHTPFNKTQSFSITNTGVLTVSKFGLQYP